MILYDRYPGGLGYSEQGFHRIRQLLQLCHEMVTECACDEGCPSCVGLPQPAAGHPQRSRTCCAAIRCRTSRRPSACCSCCWTGSPRMVRLRCCARVEVGRKPNDTIPYVIAGSPITTRSTSSCIVAAAGPKSATERPGQSVRPIELQDGCERQTAWGVHWWIEQSLDQLWPAGSECLEKGIARRSPSAAGEASAELCLLTRVFPHGIVLLDLETCGLAGSLIFLAGLLYEERGQLQLTQLWARDYSEEKALLQSLWNLVRSKPLLITFNGKSFDWPQVHDRSTLHRLGFRSRNRPAPQTTGDETTRVRCDRSADTGSGTTGTRASGSVASGPTALATSASQLPLTDAGKIHLWASANGRHSRAGDPGCLP